MLSFRHIRHLTAAIATAIALQATPADAATKPHSRTSSTKKSAKPQGRIATTRTPAKKSVAKSSTKATSIVRTSQPRVTPQHIDIAKIQPVKSLYHKREAEAPASRSLSFFGSFSSSYRYDSRMVRAAEIATARAYGHSHGSCWRYVKNALLDAGVVDSRPKTGYAKEAASELTDDYGFRRISCSDPLKAPLGSVLVYGGGGAGHVELRTKTGFVSDFTTPNPSRRPLIGVYIKP
ncbi:MAG: hypothetical protein ABIP20_04515 [Chthoniobacteraceae bacterium]